MPLPRGRALGVQPHARALVTAPDGRGDASCVEEDLLVVRARLCVEAGAICTGAATCTGGTAGAGGTVGAGGGGDGATEALAAFASPHMASSARDGAVTESGAEPICPGQPDVSGVVGASAGRGRFAGGLGIAAAADSRLSGHIAAGAGRGHIAAVRAEGPMTHWMPSLAVGG